MRMGDRFGGITDLFVLEVVLAHELAQTGRVARRTKELEARTEEGGLLLEEPAPLLLALAVGETQDVVRHLVAPPLVRRRHRRRTTQVRLPQLSHDLIDLTEHLAPRLGRLDPLQHCAEARRGTQAV